MKRWIPLLVLLLFLSGCGKKPDSALTLPTQQPSETQEVTCTVYFCFDGKTIHTQQVPLGEAVDDPRVDVPGYRLEYWYTADGSPADLTAPITENTVYHAKMYPALISHRVFLFTDENGFCNPALPLDGKTLVDALLALAEDPCLVTLELPELEEVTPNMLKKILSQYFPEERVEEVLSAYPTLPFTRQHFAQCMNTLLGQSPTDRIVFTEALTPCKDLPLESGDWLLAMLPHKRNLFTGSDVCTALWTSPWEPGYYLIDGCLYYAGEDGLPVADTQVGYLTFGPDHRYTTGDPELDQILLDFIQTAIAESPGITREEILYKAFCHCRDDLEYLRDEYFDPGTHGWETEAARKILVRTRGNCYNFAAAFCVFARALGYQAQAYSGHVGERVLPHGWVVIETEEGLFLCDPEMAQLGEQGRRDNWGEDMFWIAQEDWAPWKYVFASSDLEKWEEAS